MAISPIDKIAGTVARAFRGKLNVGTLHRYTPGTGVDSRGDPLPGTWAAHSFEGILEDYDDAYRAQAGIPQTDVHILILAGSIAVEPGKEDVIEIKGGKYQARAIRTDPATATWTVQAFASNVNVENEAPAP